MDGSTSRCSLMEHAALCLQVICERADRSDLEDIDKKKYLVPADLTVGQFTYVIRKRIKLPQEKAMFIFANKFIPPSGKRLWKSLYQYVL